MTPAPPPAQPLSAVVPMNLAKVLRVSMIVPPSSGGGRSPGRERDVGRMPDLGDLVQADVAKLAVHPPDLLHVYVEDGIAVAVVAEGTGGADVADVLKRFGEGVVSLCAAADGPERFLHRLRHRPAVEVVLGRVLADALHGTGDLLVVQCCRTAADPRRRLPWRTAASHS